MGANSSLVIGYQGEAEYLRENMRNFNQRSAVFQISNKVTPGRRIRIDIPTETSRGEVFMISYYVCLSEAPFESYDYILDSVEGLVAFLHFAGLPNEQDAKTTLADILVSICKNQSKKFRVNVRNAVKQAFLN